MKKFLLSILMVFVAGFLFAQTSGGPDAYGYTWKNNSHTVSPPAYSWFDISVIGNEVNGLSDDNVVGPFPINPNFQFYWYPLNQFWIGSNGYISFNNANIASPFPAGIPLSTGSNNWVAPFMADLIFTGSGNTAKCYYFSNADTLCISFLNVPFWYNGGPGYTGSNSFQVIFNKVDKSITFNYLSMGLGTYVPTVDYITGIENNTGTLGLAPLVDVLPSSLSTYKFYYPTTVTYAVTDAGVNWNDNDKNAANFVKKGGSPMTLTSNFKNFGNQNTVAFTATNYVKNMAGTTITTGTRTVPALLAGTDTTLDFTNTFVAPNTGIYRYQTSVSGITGDMVTSNNYIEQKLIAIDTTQTNMYLDYSDGVVDGTGISWSGGNGGIGVYIKPPVYPAKIINSKFFITANSTTAPTGFYAKIYDDDGPYGGPGTLLDSTLVVSTSIITGTYTTVPTVNTNIVINDGGVYLQWFMQAADIALGRDTTSPISRRTYETLYGSWSDYRDKYTEDFLMGITVQKYIPPIAPIANFMVDSVLDPNISFTDLSINYPTSRIWTFGDNTSSTLINPTHSYTSNGYFNVCLKVTNPTGTDSICKTIGIKKVLPIANFSFNTSLSPTISFTDGSIGSPTAWKWDFDDTGNDSSDVQNPTYTFKSNGIHNVCLKVTNIAGTSTATCKSVNVTGVGIEETENLELLFVNPNPVNNNAQIVLNNNINTEKIVLECYNLLGEKINLDYDIQGQHIDFKVDKLATGTYFFKIFDSEKTIGKGKFIVN